MTEEVLTPSQIVEIVIFYCSSTDSNILIRRKRDNAIMDGGRGGGGILWILQALYFICLSNLNTFLRKINLV